ncbi:MAG: cation diffusion facilitator family transporter, partial [Clostridia bacterium]|nr:cation diffusion facilitator family transporter [Clostridia bacterium]
LVILAVSILAKLWLFFFGRSAGKKLNSDVIRAAATDSLSDAGATLAVLISAIIAKLSGFAIDGYMGVIVAIIIFIAGIKVLNETKNSILGSAPEPEVVEGIKDIVKEYGDILGIHDMVVHNYGPGNTICSFHAEVDGKADVFEIHDCIDNVERRLYTDMGIRATIHMDPIVTDDEKVSALRGKVSAVVKEIDERLTIHDFRYVEGTTHSNLIFDVTVPFEIKENNERVKELVSDKISEIAPNYFAVITIDRE